MVKLPADEDTPEKRVKKIFSMMDKDENGSLDMEEFKEEASVMRRLYRPFHSMTVWYKRAADG